MTVMDRRRTGRTKRMLDVSVEEARAGEYVMVVVANTHEVSRVYNLLLDYEGAQPTSARNGKVYFSGGGSVSVVPPGNIDFARGSSLGAHPSVKLHADHFALEQAMGWALTEWARWSVPDETH